MTTLAVTGAGGETVPQPRLASAASVRSLVEFLTGRCARPRRPVPPLEQLLGPYTMRPVPGTADGDTEGALDGDTGGRHTDGDTDGEAVHPSA